jgi:hypothetical protein
MAVAGGTASTTTQSALDTATSISATGVITTSGSAEGLATTDSPSFAGLNITGNTILGNAATDTTTLTGRINSSVIPNATNGSFNLGSSSRPWGTVYGTATSAQYADLAEIYATDQTYKPGTVVMFGGDQEVTAAYPQATRKVAGVISTDPAYLMNSAAEGQPIALKGRVPCYVIGTVEKGDLLIASNTAGVAMVSEEYIGGAVIGKAIEASNDPGIKIIEIAVGVL